MIESAPSDQVVLEGSNVTLHCNATGNPRPNITWTKDGSSTVVHQGETYNIVGIQRQAAGDYKCTAWNGVGAQVNDTGTITVHCELIILFVTDNQINTHALIGQSAMVYCASKLMEKLCVFTSFYGLQA